MPARELARERESEGGREGGKEGGREMKQVGEVNPHVRKPGHLLSWACVRPPPPASFVGHVLDFADVFKIFADVFKIFAEVFKIFAEVFERNILVPPNECTK